MRSAEFTHQRSVLDRTDLWEALAAPASTLRIWVGDRFLEATWDRCALEATRVAVGLRRRGVEPGSCVSCVLTNSYETVLTLLGVWLAGGVVVSLPVPGRGESGAAYCAGLRSLMESVEGNLLLVDQRFAGAVREMLPGDVQVASPGTLAVDGQLEPTPPIAGDLAFVQYSSGSTSRPKGCMLSARALVTQITSLGETLGIGSGDRIVSWLPLSHDMGLFGALLMGWVRGADTTIGTPDRFLTAPATWVRDCTDAQATFTVAPNFGLRIAVRAARQRPPAGRFPLRGCIVGSDRVELPTLRQVAELLGPCGLSYETLAPAYGLAEATLAVTATRPGDGPSAISVDAEGLLRGEVREATLGTDPTTLVSCGPPIPGVHVRTSTGTDDVVGEICVRSPSLAGGYLGDPIRTARTFVGGELRTGDLGFVRDGRLYFVGRKDDVISKGGRKIHAAELEAQLGQVPGVRAGRCAVVESIRGAETTIVVLAEPDEPSNEFHRLASELRGVVARRTGIGVDELRFLPRGSLPKTPSGKVKRFACRRLAAAPTGNDLATVIFHPHRTPEGATHEHHATRNSD